MNIWEHACDVPKTLHVYPSITKEWHKFHHTIMEDGCRGEKQEIVRSCKWEFHGYRTTANNPYILSTNRESRRQALKFYQPLLRTSFSQGHSIYFNPDVDTICVNSNREAAFKDDLINAYEFAQHLCSDAAGAIQRLELYRSWWKDIPQMYMRVRQLTYDQNLVCESLWGNCSPRNYWNRFHNLKQISIIQPLTTGPAFWYGSKIKTIRTKLEKEFQAMKAEDPSVTVPHIVVRN